MLVDLFSFFLVLLFSVFFLSYDRMIAKKEQALFFFYASGIYATILGESEYNKSFAGLL
jgi:hypothetical protein